MTDEQPGIGEQPGVWVYAVIPTGSVLPPVTGVDGSALQRVTRAGLAAVVSPVGWAAQGELESQLRDPERLERVARAHHDVVTACFRVGPTVPFRLGTLYRGEPGVRELLDQRRAELVATLEIVTGRVEWGVQAYAAAAGEEPEAAVEPGGANPGTAYLLQRRARRMARARAEQAARELADHLDATLAAVAVASRPQSSVGDRYRADATGTQVLNMSYLVEETAGAEFQATVERLARQHAQVAFRLTGPWPAYSFVEVKGGERE